MRLVVALALPLLFACSHAPKYKNIEWPSPPDKARVRFVTAFSSVDDLDTSSSGHLKRTLFGSSGAVRLAQPMGLALSKDGKRLFIADLMLNRVVVADLDGRTLEAFAPADPMGLVVGVALDAEENVYVTESKNHEVLVFDPRGHRIRQFGMAELVRPTGIAIDQRRQLVYVVDSAKQDSEKHRVLVYSPAGEYLHQLVGPDGESGRGDGPGQFYFPSYVTLDATGNVYVADGLNFRIQVFDPEGRFVRKFGEMGEGPGTFNKLKGLAFDGFGNLYAVDGAHASVQIFNRSFDVLTYFGGPAPFVEYMQLPTAIAIDPANNRIYVAQTGTPRINVYDLINTTAEDSTLPPPSSPEQAAAAR